MINKLYEDVLSGVEVRKNLIEIKKAIKTKAEKRAFIYLLAGDFTFLSSLLKSEDAKTRKNTALILGELECQELMDILYKSYEAETQLFVKSSYLSAINNYDYSSYLPRLKERLEMLAGTTPEPQNEKHIREEITILQGMILRKEKPSPHKFTGFHQEVEVILMTNRYHQEVTANQITCGEVKKLAIGLKVSTNDLETILSIRTYSEILFALGGSTLRKEPTLMARELKVSGLLTMLENLHDGAEPFYFRIELKNKMDLENRGAFTREIAFCIEKEHNRQLINSTSNYEVELRLIENKEGRYLPLIKLYTMKDERFSYRQEVVASSITPINAALIANLAKPYLKEGAQIVDPFCGVGTMLIERNRLVSANPMYGIDTFQEAIEKGKSNAANSETIINYVQRSFFDFKHEYLFDEIITDMPTRSSMRNKEEIDIIYKKFFPKAFELLHDKGIVIMYCNEKNIVKKYLRLNKKFRLVREFMMDERLETYVFILKVDKIPASIGDE